MIVSFKGDYFFLSNFFPCPIETNLYGTIYTFPTVEHAFQASKIPEKHQDMIREFHTAHITPAEAKRLGRLVPLRIDWEDVKLQIMTELVRTKFRNPVLGGKLKNTNPHELIHGNNHHDRFWGAEFDHLRILRGENHLGKISMGVRAELLDSERVS